jgi:hypothetical protein
MREIHETIINMLATKIGKVNTRNLMNLSLDNVPPAYKKFGDTLSGICSINWKSPNFWSIYKSILNMSEKLNFSQFASNFYLALKGAKLDRICSIYVPTNLRQPTKHWNVEAVESMIKTQSAILLKTDVGNEFKNVINDYKTVEDVSKFYPKDLVVHVINLVKSVTKIKT